MLRLKDIPPEQMPEIVRIAGELYERDQQTADQDKQRQDYVAAAEELGVPQEYLERAADELHRRRVGESHQRSGSRKLLYGGIAAGLLATVVIVGTFGTRTARAPVATTPPAATTPVIFESFEAGSETRWTLDRDTGTLGQISFPQEAGRGQVAAIRVEKFGATRYRANLNSLVPPAAATGNTLAFDARGQGLRNIRVYFERGSQERWRSPELRIPDNWRPISVQLSNFEHQTRSGNGEWRVTRRSRPPSDTTLSFKVGTFINSRESRGEVRLDDLRFH
jgi:hypothetical protein